MLPITVISMDSRQQTVAVQSSLPATPILRQSYPYRRREYGQEPRVPSHILLCKYSGPGYLLFLLGNHDSFVPPFQRSHPGPQPSGTACSQPWLCFYQNLEAGSNKSIPCLLRPNPVLSTLGFVALPLGYHDGASSDKLISQRLAV